MIKTRLADRYEILGEFGRGGMDQGYCFARPELEGLTSIGQSNAVIPYEDLWIRR